MFGKHRARWTSTTSWQIEMSRVKFDWRMLSRRSEWLTVSSGGHEGQKGLFLGLKPFNGADASQMARTEMQLVAVNQMLPKQKSKDGQIYRWLWYAESLSSLLSGLANSTSEPVPSSGLSPCGPLTPPPHGQLFQVSHGKTRHREKARVMLQLRGGAVRVRH